MLSKASNRRSRGRLHMLCSASVGILVGLGVSSSGFAQTAAAQQPTAQAPKADDTTVVVVTSTRVVRNGYKAPTPTTVITPETIAAAAQPNLANFVNELPSVSGSATPASQVAYASNGTNSINALNLRNLGQNRTLVLLDGQRVGPATTTGWVDINTFPQSLVKRIDVVTGGASADWGSDAVAGVVNFVLDKDFTGIKGELSGGLTNAGDDHNSTLSLAAGAPFADGRGHVLVSVDAASDAGVQYVPRSWYNGLKAIQNPNYTGSNGQPSILVLPNVGFYNGTGNGVTPGGVIMSGPLTGTYFGAGGTRGTLNWPNQASSGGSFIQGGDWRLTDDGADADLLPATSRWGTFLRTSYEVSDHFQVFGQFSYNTSTSRVNNFPNWWGGQTIQPDNAFIPASIASQITGPFTLGTLNQDLGEIQVVTRRNALRAVLGASGDFDALGSNWKWNAYVQATENDNYVSTESMMNTLHYTNAIDAVRDPATNAIVCRSTLTDPTNGCVPYNVFGTGVNSAAAIKYIDGASWEHIYLRENVASYTVTGNPIQDWAGPISVATGIEYRHDSESGSNDPTSLLNQWFEGNYKASRLHGGYSVTEGFFETVVPLAKDLPFAKSLDFNGAVRETNYSFSGLVTTWKAGLTWQPVDDITFRATQSRDIRAPNLAELYQAGQTTTIGILDPFHNNASRSVFQVTNGNLDLTPEKSDTTAFGVVFQPSFLPGFQASVDYYHIDISQAITTLDAQTVINECFIGYTALCSGITRNGSDQITAVTVQPVNFAGQKVSGVDYEASYSRPLLNGKMTLHALATNNLHNITDNGITAPIDSVGGNNQGPNASGGGDGSVPKWRYFATARWDNGTFAAQLTARGFSAGVLNTTYIECSTNCPVQTALEAGNHPTINDNHAPGALYFDTNFTYNLPTHTPTSVFLTINNIGDKAPALIGSTAGLVLNGTNPNLYDTLGRTYRFGIRFKM